VGACLISDHRCPPVTCTFLGRTILCVCRGIYLAAVFYHKDSLLVTAEDQIPIVEVDDSYSSSLMQDFLWFTKVQRS